MSQFPAVPLDQQNHAPPPLPSWCVPQGPRGPIGGPPRPYQPEGFSTLYLWWAICVGVCLVVLVPAIAAHGLQILAIPAALAAVALETIILYRSWNQIQDGFQRASPGRAVGFGFIPFFNFYWWFVEYQGLAEDLNAFTRKYGLNAQPVSATLAMVLCIISICKWLLFWFPVIGALLIIAEIVLQFIFLRQVRDASEAVARAKIIAAMQAGTLPAR